MTTRQGDTADDVSSLVRGSSPAPAIVLVASPHRDAIAVRPPASLGRTIEADGLSFEIADDRMSRAHAQVTWERGAWRITDLGSRNGTFVDGVRITRPEVRHGDTILRLGHTVFALLVDGRGHPAPPSDPVVGPELARVYDQIRALANGTTLLVHGESGSGKELAARLYHEAGPRRGGPFVAVNCATIPEGVAERLLFGSKRGAFSGAVDAVGHFQAADGGTLFLDEIAELDTAVQAKVLRAIETREAIPVGGCGGTALELGVVAASHRELRAAVAAGRFREDLYYRIAGATVHLPPLRARKVDIARLVERELALFDGGYAAHPKLIEACCIRPWPGNIRELRSAVRQAAVGAREEGRQLVRVGDLSPSAGTLIDTAAKSDRARAGSPVDLDRETVVTALANANGVVSVAARALGLHRTQLYRLMERHQIAREEDA